MYNYQLSTNRGVIPIEKVGTVLIWTYFVTI
jgi:hypothetical protein